MEVTTRLLKYGALLGALLGFVACAGDPLSSARQAAPTSRPVIQITPAPAQNVRATATAFARQIIPTPTPAGLYIVKPGDTLSRIADEHATTVDEIMAANNLSDPNLIEVGRRLIIPSGDQAPETTAEQPVGEPVATVLPAEPAAPVAP